MGWRLGRFTGTIRAPTGNPTVPAPTPSVSTEAKAAYAARNATIAGGLTLALIVICAAMALLGPTMADAVLALLGCPGGADCGLLLEPLGRRFAAFYRAQQLLDVPFIFLVQFWPAILAAIALILYVRYRTPPKTPLASASPAQRLRRLSTAYRWAERLAWAWSAGLVAFCVLLGTPILAAGVARAALFSLGCEVDLWRFRLPLAAFGSGREPPACLEWPGFWIPRLRDYVESIDGWFIAPYLLVLHFGWLILAWAVSAALLFGLARLVRWASQARASAARYPGVGDSQARR